MSDNSPKTSYDGDSVKVLKGLEAVRKRPGMYIGDTDDGSGLHHMIYEVVDNAIDEALAGYCDQVCVSLNVDGSVTVADNGRGIPVDMHPTENRPTVEVVMTELHAGGKFDQNSYKVSGGLHGVGVSVVNALSDHLDVTVYRDGKEHYISFKDGHLNQPMAIVGDCADKKGTEVTFWPSPEVFSSTEFNGTTVERRLRELAFLNSGVKIAFRDEKAEAEEKVFHYQGGISAFVEHIDKSRESVLSKPIIAKGTKAAKVGSGEVEIEVDVALTWNTGHSENVKCFTNNIPQKDGGQHLSGLRTALTRCVTTYAEKNLSSRKKIALSADDIREGMTCVLSVKMPDPKFSSQTKEKLVSSEVNGPVQTIVAEALNVWLEENPAEARSVIGKAAEAAAAREAARLAREKSRNNKSSLEISNLVGKLKDCAEKDPSKTELFIVEGDSAGGSAQVGRNKDNQAILPLRGKVLNVERARRDRALASDQIGTLVTALGCGVGEDDYDIEKLRYHKIIIMTDADVDGAHIRTLLLTFFHKYMPELIDRGYVYIAQPPLYSVAKGSKKEYLLDDDALNDYLLNQGVQGLTVTLGDGTQIEGQELKQKLKDEQSVSNRIRNIDVNIGCLPLTTALAVTGAWHPSAFESREKGQKAVDYICSIMPKRMPKTKWSGKVDADGFRFTFRQRGVDNTVLVPSGIYEHPSVKILLGGYEALSKSYAEGVTVKLHDEETIFCEPQSLFDYVLAKGGKGLELQRYKGLGEMNADQLWDTTLDPEKRSLLQVQINDETGAAGLISTLMGEIVEPRRDYIVENAASVQNIDT